MDSNDDEKSSNNGDEKTTNNADERSSNEDETDINNSGNDKRRKISSATAPDSPCIMPSIQHYYRTDDFLNLRLSSFPSVPRATGVDEGDVVIPGARRLRRNSGRALAPGRSATIPPPYPWSGTGRATVRSLSYLRENRISVISGDVQCKKCEQSFQVEFDLEQKFMEVTKFIVENKANMHHRAPKAWMSPALPRCIFCNQENNARPVIAEKKRAINWLFLLLGQMMGCCTLDQLKYFCKHTKNHRTGAKDRVLFLAYLGLCSQLDPHGPYGL